MLCYGHKSSTGTVRRIFHQKSYNSTAPVQFLIKFSDIVRCPVNFRYYLKFHGACTAFRRVTKGKITSAGHRTVHRRLPASDCTHRTGTGRFLFNIYIVRFLRRPSGHRTMSDKHQELSKIAKQIGRCPSGHRPMFYESNCHR